MRRYAFDTLAEAAGMEPHLLAAHLGISGSTWKKYRSEGMSEVVADRRAAQCGFVAWQVWPEMLEHAIADEAERRRAKKAEYQRRYYARHAEQMRERNRRYWAETVEYQRKRKQRFYRDNAERLRAEARERYQASKRGDTRDVKDVA